MSVRIESSFLAENFLPFQLRILIPDGDISETTRLALVDPVLYARFLEPSLNCIVCCTN